MVVLLTLVFERPDPKTISTVIVTLPVKLWNKVLGEATSELSPLTPAMVYVPRQLRNGPPPCLYLQSVPAIVIWSPPLSTRNAVPVVRRAVLKVNLRLLPDTAMPVICHALLWFTLVVTSELELTVHVLASA